MTQLWRACRAMRSKLARRDQSLEDVDRFIGEVKSWNDARQARQNERRGQFDVSPNSPRHFDSQIQALSIEVLGAANLLRCYLTRELDINRLAGDVYQDCAHAEEQLLWLWRVWYYFQDKYDQRLDTRFSDTLMAADEVVWSCYRAFFRVLTNGRVPEPAPLPYIEPQFSPLALRRDERQVLASRGKDFKLVADAFGRLPVSIIKIPITAASSPWALVFVGHEVGHIIQPMIAPEFPNTFKTVISRAVPEQDANEWGEWSREIFADWYPIITMGPWAVWALAQFEFTSRQQMIQRRGQYPSRVVRLQLIAEMAQSYGLPARELLSELDISLGAEPDDPKELMRDLESIPGLVKAIRSLAELEAMVLPIQFSAQKYSLKRVADVSGQNVSGEVEQWSHHLVESGPRPPSTNVRSARMAAAGVAHAWHELVFLSNSEPDKARLNLLRTAATAAIAGAAEPSVRAAAGMTSTGKEPGRVLLDLIADAMRSSRPIQSDSSSTVPILN
jgi:hypothetical protein